MKKLVTIILFLYVANSYCAFSAFEIITPKNEKKHDFSVTLREISENNHSYYEVKISKSSSYKTFWLIETRKKLSYGELIFREFIWDKKDPNKNIVSSKQLEILTAKNKNGTQEQGVYIKLKIPKEKIHRSYVYTDSSMPIFDGGYYYTIDLSSYLSEISK